MRSFFFHDVTGEDVEELSNSKAGTVLGCFPHHSFQLSATLFKSQSLALTKTPRLLAQFKRLVETTCCLLTLSFEVDAARAIFFPPLSYLLRQLYLSVSSSKHALPLLDRPQTRQPTPKEREKGSKAIWPSCRVYSWLFLPKSHAPPSLAL